MLVVEGYFFRTTDHVGLHEQVDRKPGAHVRVRAIHGRNCHLRERRRTGGRDRKARRKLGIRIRWKLMEDKVNK